MGGSFPWSAFDSLAKIKYCGLTDSRLLTPDSRLLPRMRHLVFVRHGESALNALSRTVRHYCGQVETPLTDAGRQQAIGAGKKLAQLGYVEPKSAISSPLARAVETLSLIADQLAPSPSILPPSPNLMERSHGVFEGVPEEIVFRDYPHYRDHPDYCHFMNHFGQCAPGGETLQTVSDRAWSAIRELTASTSGDLVIVSHFNPIRCVIGRALDMTQAETLRLHIPNAEPIIADFSVVSVAWLFMPPRDVLARPAVTLLGSVRPRLSVTSYCDPSPVLTPHSALRNPHFSTPVPRPLPPDPTCSPAFPAPPTTPLSSAPAPTAWLPRSRSRAPAAPSPSSKRSRRSVAALVRWS